MIWIRKPRLAEGAPLWRCLAHPFCDSRACFLCLPPQDDSGKVAKFGTVVRGIPTGNWLKAGLAICTADLLLGALLLRVRCSSNITKIICTMIMIMVIIFILISKSNTDNEQ